MKGTKYVSKIGFAFHFFVFCLGTPVFVRVFRLGNWVCLALFRFGFLDVNCYKPLYRKGLR